MHELNLDLRRKIANLLFASFIVTLRRQDRTVTERFSDNVDIGAAFKHSGCESTTHVVRREIPNASCRTSSAKNLVNAVAGNGLCGYEVIALANCTKKIRASSLSPDDSPAANE